MAKKTKKTKAKPDPGHPVIYATRDDVCYTPNGDLSGDSERIQIWRSSDGSAPERSGCGHWGDNGNPEIESLGFVPLALPSFLYSGVFPFLCRDSIFRFPPSSFYLIEPTPLSAAELTRRKQHCETVLQ